MLGQAYVAAIGLIMVPTYIRFMGVEAYGLISFFVALQTWFALLDMGISPTLTREVACFHAGSKDGVAVWKFVRSAECLFLILGAMSLLLVSATSHWLAEDWLQLHDISVSDAQICIVMMGGMLGGRWLTGLYRSGLVGMTMLPTVNIVAVVLATLRSVLVVALLYWVSTDCKVFFAYQTVLSVIELLSMASIFYRVMPRREQVSFKIDLVALTPALRFAGAMAMLTVIWGIVGQLDRIVLSHFLNLQSFGGYAVATLAASGVTLLATPFLQALQPRFVFLAERSDEPALLELYRFSTQVLTLLLTVTGGTAIFFGEKLLWIWTGNDGIARNQALVLGLYAAGNVFLAFSSLVFQLQYARGNIRAHVQGSLVASIAWAPPLVFAAWRYGGGGTGSVWLIGNVLYFFVWMMRIQWIMLPQLKWRVWLQDIVWIPLAALPVFAAGIFLVRVARYRWEGLGAVAIVVCGVSIVGAMASRSIRVKILSLLRKVTGTCRFR